MAAQVRPRSRLISRIFSVRSARLHGTMLLKCRGFSARAGPVPLCNSEASSNGRHQVPQPVPLKVLSDVDFPDLLAVVRCALGLCRRRRAEFPCCIPLSASAPSRIRSTSSRGSDHAARRRRRGARAEINSPRRPDGRLEVSRDQLHFDRRPGRSAHRGLSRYPRARSGRPRRSFHRRGRGRAEGAGGKRPAPHGVAAGGRQARRRAPAPVGGSARRPFRSIAHPRPYSTAIAGFPIHRGILALGRRPPLPSAEELLVQMGPRALVVLLFGIANHDNIGGIFRNAAAFGADAVILDGQCCDPHYRKAIRVSVRRQPDRAVRAARPRGGCGRSPWPVMGSRRCRSARRARRRWPGSPGRRGWPRCSEPRGRGCRPRCWRAPAPSSIPMAGGFDSLNVATTSGIVLHHLACGAATPAETPPARPVPPAR